MQLLKRHRRLLQAASLTQSLLMLVLFSSTSLVSAAVEKTNSANKANSAKDVLQLVLQAYGGPAKVKEHRERGMRSHATISSISGISSAENSYECDILEKADKVRVEMTMLGTPMIVLVFIGGSAAGPRSSSSSSSSSSRRATFTRSPTT